MCGGENIAPRERLQLLHQPKHEPNEQPDDSPQHNSQDD